MLNLSRGTGVQNIQGTSSCAPRGSAGTWKQFYTQRTGFWPSCCCIFRCGNGATGGAHVRISGQHGVWIIPMCSEHNSAYNFGWMVVDEGTIAVRVDERYSSGPSGVCFGS